MKTANFLLSPLHFNCRVFVYLAVFSTLHLQGQSIAEYKSSQEKIIDTTILNLKESKGLGLLSFAPNISYNQSTGVNYGISISNIVSFIQTKKRNKIETAKLEYQLMERLENKIDKAKEKEIEIKNIAASLKIEIAILKEKFELYKIYFLQYNNQEITYSKYTESKISYMESFKSTFQKLDNLQLKITRFYNDYNYKPLTIDELLKTAIKYEI